MDKATRHFLFVNKRNAHNIQKHTGYTIITKNFKEGLFDHEDKGTTNLRNVRKYSPNDTVSVPAEVSKDCSSFSFRIKLSRPLLSACPEEEGTTILLKSVSAHQMTQHDVRKDVILNKIKYFNA